MQILCLRLSCGKKLCLQILLSVLLIVSLVLVRPLDVYASDYIDYFTFMSPYNRATTFSYHFFASDDLSSTGSTYNNYDVYIPFYLQNFNRIYTDGEYVTDFDIADLRIYPFSTYKANWMMFSTVEVLDSRFQSAGVVYDNIVFTNGGFVGLSGSRFQYGYNSSFVDGFKGSNYVRFDWFCKQLPVTLADSVSSTFYLHLVFSAVESDLYLTFDASEGILNTGTGFVKISDKTVVGEIQDVEGAVNDVNDTIKQEHQEEVDQSDELGGSIGTKLTDVTNTLSAVEILKLPWTMLTDIYTIFTFEDTVGTLKFPAFSVMGYQIWPDYFISLPEINSRFPVLFNACRSVSGFGLCFGFGSYLRFFYVKVFGSSGEEGD